LTFNNDDDEEYFCRLFICFKSWSKIFNSFVNDSIVLRKKTNQIQEKSNFIFSLYHFIYDEHGLEILYVF
jgi:hypothetical protein